MFETDTNFVEIGEVLKGHGVLASQQGDTLILQGVPNTLFPAYNLNISFCHDDATSSYRVSCQPNLGGPEPGAKLDGPLAPSNWMELEVAQDAGEDFSQVLLRTLCSVGCDLDLGLDEAAADSDWQTRAPEVDATLVKQFGRDVTQEAYDGLLEGPIFGRDREMRSLCVVLHKSKKRNPVLVGPAGCGKTAVVEGFCQRIVDGEVPALLQSVRVIEIIPSALMAGAKHLGDFEERVNKVINLAEQTADLYLFMDEIHLLTGMGVPGMLDAASIFKPALSRGKLALIGATTPGPYRQIEKDSALERRFRKVQVGEPPRQVVQKILRAEGDRAQKRLAVQVTDELLPEIINLSDRYLRTRCQPDISIDLLQEACAELAIDTAEAEPPEQQPAVTLELLGRVVENQTGLPASEVTQERMARLQQMPSFLGQQIRGQDAHLASICRAIQAKAMGFLPRQKPLVVLMMGNTGCGKTETVNWISRFLFHGQEPVRENMQEFSERHSGAKLIGAPPGYVRSDEGGRLVEALKQRPYSVVLLDEIEKAHPNVLSLLLQFFDEGRITDGHGTTIDIRESFIFMTSNIGGFYLDEIRQTGFAAGDASSLVQQISSAQKGRLRALRKYFSPELISRLNQVVVFDPLGLEQLSQICRLKLQRRAAESGYDVKASDEVIQLILEGINQDMGARDLDRCIQHVVMDRLLQVVMDHDTPRGTTLEAAVKKGEVVLTVEAEGTTCPVQPVANKPAGMTTGS